MERVDLDKLPAPFALGLAIGELEEGRREILSLLEELPQEKREEFSQRLTPLEPLLEETRRKLEGRPSCTALFEIGKDLVEIDRLLERLKP